MRPEKKLIIEDVKQQIDGSPFLLLTDYTGLTVQHFSDLRKRLGDAGAECHVVRNSMLSRAIEAAGLEKPNGALVGMTAMVIGSNEAEITAIAKILRDFAKDTERSSVKLGYMGQEKIDADQVKALAELPGKDELRARLVGLLQAPARQIAVVLGAPAQQIAQVLRAKAEQSGQDAAA
nr:50S ribosomal protein L10 [Desulfuromonadales bacterium]